MCTLQTLKINVYTYNNKKSGLVDCRAHIHKIHKNIGPGFDCQWTQKKKTR